MLATTIQITNNPPHTTHTNNNRCQLAAQATTTTKGSGRSHGVEREPDSVLARITSYAQPKTRTHTHHPLSGSKHMQAQENNTTHQPNGQHAALFPTKLGSLERR